MTAVNNTSRSLQSVCVVLYTSCCFCLHQSTGHLLFHCVMRSTVYFVSVPVARGRTIFHKAPPVRYWCTSPNTTPLLWWRTCSLCACMSKVCRIGVVLRLKTRPNGTGGISAAVGHGFPARSKSRWSNFITGGINHTPLSLGQTEGLGG